jgi:hypothetical protein
MHEVNLDEGKIKVKGEWVSAEELTRKIQDKIEAKDLKISGLAKALEHLSHAIENSHALEIKLVLTKEEYGRFRAKAGEDDREGIRKAISAYIAKGQAEVQSGTQQAAESAPASGQAEEKMLELTLPSVSGKSPLPETAAVEEGPATVKCIKCKSPIEVSPDADPEKTQCPKCSAAGPAKAKASKETRYQDHFLG